MTYGKGLTVPGIVVKMVMRMIRGTVTKTANFNVRDLCPIKHADRTFIPALFVAGKADDFIQPHHRYLILSVHPSNDLCIYNELFFAVAVLVLFVGGFLPPPPLHARLSR